MTGEMPEATDPKMGIGKAGIEGIKPCSASRETCQRGSIGPADGVFRDGETDPSSERFVYLIASRNVWKGR